MRILDYISSNNERFVLSESVSEDFTSTDEYVANYFEDLETLSDDKVEEAIEVLGKIASFTTRARKFAKDELATRIMERYIDELEEE